MPRKPFRIGVSWNINNLTDPALKSQDIYAARRLPDERKSLQKETHFLPEIVVYYTLE